MDLRQLEYFVAVVEEAGFTRAAERVHISQSGVSAQVKALERELGAPLLDRATRTVRPTAAGRAALGPARVALAAVADVRRAVDDVTGVVRGELAVGMVVGCTSGPLFEGLAAFHRAHAGVVLRLTEADSDLLVAGVRDGRLDVGLVGVPALPEGLASTTLVREPLVAAVPPGHPLVDGDGVQLAALVEHPLVLLPAGTGVRTVFDRVCADRGLGPDVYLQASAPEAVADLARRGLGVAVLNRSMLAGTAGLHPVPLADVGTPSLLALVWREEPDRACSELLAHLHTAFGHPPPPAARALRWRAARAAPVPPADPVDDDGRRARR